MTTKQRIKQLEKVRSTGAKRYAVEVGGRYFDLTEDMRKPFTYDRVLRLAWTADNYAAAGFPELTAADYADLNRWGLNDCMNIDNARLLTPSG